MRTLPGKPRKLDGKSLIAQRFYQAINELSFIPSSNRYNLTISHTKKFIWFRVAKVGTRTILNYMKQNNVQLDVEHAHGVYYPHKLYSEYLKFAFVRNPWDRLVSCWTNKVRDNNYFRFDDVTYKKMQDFENFVRYVSCLDINTCDPHLRLQSALININDIDYLGRMESFNEDISSLFNRLEISLVNLDSKNVSSNKKPYQTYYNDKLVEQVADIYQKDIQTFGYTF